MKLQDLLRTECIRVNSSADDKALALCEIAALAKESKVLKRVSEEAVLEALQERETLGTTAFGSGIAIPHCRMRDVKDFVVGVMTVPAGVEFESEDGKKVRLIVFIIGPRDQSDTHIRLLSTLSQILQDESMVEKIIKAKSAENVRSLLLAGAGGEITERAPVYRNLVHVFVQDDKVFHGILEKLSSLEGTSMSIFDAASARPYLKELPLYAGFSENGESVCKVIVLIVEQRLCNEVVRRIETITGSLHQCIGVMVTVQELTYSAGSLEV